MDTQWIMNVHNIRNTKGLSRKSSYLFIISIWLIFRHKPTHMTKTPLSCWYKQQHWELIPVTSQLTKRAQSMPLRWNQIILSFIRFVINMKIDGTSESWNKIWKVESLKEIVNQKETRAATMERLRLSLYLRKFFRMARFLIRLSICFCEIYKTYEG